MANICMICYEEASSDIDCNGPIHKIAILEEQPVAEIQVNKYGVYVNPETGKIVKAKALNNPVTLGKE